MHHDPEGWVLPGFLQPLVGVVQHGQPALAVVDHELVVVPDHLDEGGLLAVAPSVVHVEAVQEAAIRRPREDGLLVENPEQAFPVRLEVDRHAASLREGDRVTTTDNSTLHKQNDIMREVCFIRRQSDLFRSRCK